MFRNENGNKKNIKTFQNWNINLIYKQFVPKWEQELKKGMFCVKMGIPLMGGVAIDTKRRISE